jgi:hypothetical protein
VVFLKILKNKNYKANKLYIIRESIYESFLFLTFGFILNKIFEKNKNIFIFYIRFFIKRLDHLLMIYINIHQIKI